MNAHHDHRGIYKLIWGTLLVLTIITVWVAYHDFGIFNIVVAMAIASVKASLVCLYFMHLKYDNRVNQVVFVSSFVFLAIFVVFTASDELFRPQLEKAKVSAMAVNESNQAAEHEKYRKISPELLAHGREVFTLQCQTCHGAGGKGDGPAAGALNPKPRDFTSGTWTQGGAPSQVFHTVTQGIPGTGMSSFASLSVQDRWAAVHYIRSLSPNAPEETAETLAKSGIMGDGKKSQEGSGAKLPLEFAMERVLEEAKIH